MQAGLGQNTETKSKEEGMGEPKRRHILLKDCAMCFKKAMVSLGVVVHDWNPSTLGG